MVKRGEREKNGDREKQPSQDDTKAEGAESRSSTGSKKAFEIDIFRGWCKSCGICSAFCPRQCIEKDETGAPVVSDASRCTGCGWCELHCPDFAINVRLIHDKPRESKGE